MSTNTQREQNWAVMNPAMDDDPEGQGEQFGKGAVKGAVGEVSPWRRIDGHHVKNLKRTKGLKNMTTNDKNFTPGSQQWSAHQKDMPPNTQPAAPALPGACVPVVPVPEKYKPWNPLTGGSNVR